MTYDIYPSWEHIKFNEKTEGATQMIRECIMRNNYEFDEENSFLSALGMMMGRMLVYRIFEAKLSCGEGVKEDNRGTYDITEKYRYVFTYDEVIYETKDGKRKLISPLEINTEDIYDLNGYLGEAEKRKLYQDFMKHSDTVYKPVLDKALKHLNTHTSRLNFGIFAEVYGYVSEESNIPEDTPSYIVKDLFNNKYSNVSEARISENAVVIIRTNFLRRIHLPEQIRLYADEKGYYVFRKNSITERWIKEEPFTGNNLCALEADVDAGIFKCTCLETAASSTMNTNPEKNNKISPAFVLAVHEFICAEQAAKIDSVAFLGIVDSIYLGEITDKKANLSDLLGITGHQLKLINSIDFPSDVVGFGKYMNDDGFKKAFPDVKKRMFAAAFYLNALGYMEDDEIKKEDIFLSAKTLYSLESIKDREKRKMLSSDYRDYLRIRQNCMEHKKTIDRDDPLFTEIEEFCKLPVNMKPSAIRDYHNKAVRLSGIMGSSESITDQAHSIEIQKKKDSGKVEYTNGRYSVILPQNAADIMREGRILGHCVGYGGYIESMAKGKCRILFLRNNADITAPFITMEERDGYVEQCYGKCDTYNSSITVRDFIEEYALKRDIKIDCIIYRDESGDSSGRVSEEYFFSEKDEKRAQRARYFGVKNLNLVDEKPHVQRPLMEGMLTQEEINALLAGLDDYTAEWRGE